MRCRRAFTIFLVVILALSFLVGINLHALLANPAWKSEESFPNFTAPTFTDFSINDTRCGVTAQWNYSLTDSYGLVNATMSFNNGTANLPVSTYTFTGSPTSGNALMFFTLPGVAENVTFSCTAYDSYSSSTTGMRWMLVYPSNSAIPYFLNLGTAITTVENANNWSQVDPYDAYVLQNNVSSLQSAIDTYANAGDWSWVLKLSAACNKLGILQQKDLEWALGNFTMVGNYLPYTAIDQDSQQNSFCVEDSWVLYGLYWANQSWDSSYDGGALTTIWNISAAYTEFDSAVNYSTSLPVWSSGLPLWIDNSTWGHTYTNRYYDEDACTIEDYLIFGELLKPMNSVVAADAMTKALYWWNYLVTAHWNPSQQFFQYVAGDTWYECEAGFFLKIIAQLKYYYSTLGNWSYVITDIGNRFLSSEWNSKQWLDTTTNVTTYVVVHAWGSGATNNERRLQNTLGAWQALLGAYLQFNSAYQANLQDMLLGNQNTQPAWEELLSPDFASNGGLSNTGAGLFDSTSDLFSLSSADDGYTFSTNANATALGEILMFMMGIVPGTTTIAFPLEQLIYEYTWDIDPAILAFNSTARRMTLPVNGPGTITFQYGNSPISYYFNQSGVYTVSFTGSWNMFANVTYVGPLPSNVLYLAPILNYPITQSGGGTSTCPRLT